MKKVFLSFADTRFKCALYRLGEQASCLNIFDEIHLCNELSLEKSFVKQKHAWFTRRTRGFGFWSWKPYLIERHARQLSIGDLLIYSDSGNHLASANSRRFDEYVNIAASSPAHIISPVLSSRYLEVYYSKKELLAHLKADMSNSVLFTPQREANFIILVISSPALEFLREWNSVHEQFPSLFDDSLAEGQATSFVDHRHDQSTFSVLSKLHGGAVIPSTIDDFVERRRDRVVGGGNLGYLTFLMKNGLLVERIGLSRSDQRGRPSKWCKSLGSAPA